MDFFYYSLTQLYFLPTYKLRSVEVIKNYVKTTASVYFAINRNRTTTRTF